MRELLKHNLLTKAVLLLFTTCMLALSTNAKPVAAITDTLEPVPSPPTNLSITSGGTYINLSWTTDYEEYTVDIYRSTKAKGTYTLIKDDYECYSNSYFFNDYSAVAGVTYYYKICISGFYDTYAYYDDEGNYVEDEYHHFIANSKMVSLGSCLIPIDKPVITEITSGNSCKLKVTFTGSDGADGYYIYRSTEKNGTYTKVATRTAKNKYNDSKTIYTYTKSGLKLGQKYYYKVRPYVIYDGVKYFSPYSKIKSKTVTINTTKIKSAYSDAKGTNTINWKKVDNADGYMVYYATSENGKYKKLKTLKGKNNTSYTHKKLKNGKIYYYKIVAYKYLKGTKLKSTSVAYAKRCNYLAFADETYTEKCMRVFGKTYYKDYTSQTQATKNMTNVTIKVWDLDSNGNYYTRKFTISVNKHLAPTVKQMFKEIYNSSEKIPIHSIGCYSWRGDNSTSEHCEGLAIDINPDENYMIDSGTILSGSFWNPKKSKYSIPLNCDLVDIMEKYGFTRGFWGDRKDYMHFSYFGT